VIIGPELKEVLMQSYKKCSWAETFLGAGIVPTGLEVEGLGLVSSSPFSSLHASILRANDQSLDQARRKAEGHISIY
jgi:hypothetical protein